MHTQHGGYDGVGERLRAEFEAALGGVATRSHSDLGYRFYGEVTGGKDGQCHFEARRLADGRVVRESRTAAGFREALLICAKQWDEIYAAAVSGADEFMAGEHRRAELLVRMLSDVARLEGRALDGEGNLLSDGADAPGRVGADGWDL